MTLKNRAPTSNAAVCVIVDKCTYLLFVPICTCLNAEHRTPGCTAAFFKSYFRMGFFSSPWLLSELTDWIKGIGFPQTLRVINISADPDAKHCRSAAFCSEDIIT